MIYEASFNFKIICFCSLSNRILLLVYYGVRPQLCHLLTVGLGRLPKPLWNQLPCVPAIITILTWYTFLIKLLNPCMRCHGQDLKTYNTYQKKPSIMPHSVSHRRASIKLIPFFLLSLERLLTHFKLMSRTISHENKGQNC